MGRPTCSNPSNPCIPGCGMCLPMAAIPAPNSMGASPKSANGPYRSSSAPTPPSGSNSCRELGGGENLPLARQMPAPRKGFRSHRYQRHRMALPRPFPPAHKGNRTSLTATLPLRFRLLLRPRVAANRSHKE